MPKRNCARGQVSTEITVIIGFVALLMLPILVSVYMQLIESNQQLSLSQANIAASRLAYAIDSVGNLGTNASMVVELKIPDNIEGITVMGTSPSYTPELVFLMSAPTQNQIVKQTRFNIIRDSSIDRVKKPGTYNVEVLSQEGTSNVLIRLRPYG